MASVHWSARLFGKTLIKCATIQENHYEIVDTINCLSNSIPVIGIYFSFANINAQKEETSSYLLSLYHKLNNDFTLKSLEQGNNEDVHKQLEIVQIVLWANNDIFGDFETSHKESILNMPWLAVPFNEIDLKTKLSRRYRIKVGVPQLVLLDADGSTITVSGKERLVEDPLGDFFPWKPRPVDDVLQDIELISGSLYAIEHEDSLENLKFYKDLPKDSIKAFYFSANWCPPCRAFTPQLIETYKLVRKKDPNFEIIFVSSDRSIESFTSYLTQMPWLAVPYESSKVRSELAQIYGVRGIPTILLIDGNGQMVSQDARTEILDDPSAQNYPWRPRPVNILNERYSVKLHENPAVLLFIDEEIDIKLGEDLLRPAAMKYYTKNNLNMNNLQEDYLHELNLIQFLVAPDSETSDLIKDLVGLEDLVPLLVIIDLPNNRYATLDASELISIELIECFVEKYENNQLEFKTINQHHHHQ